MKENSVLFFIANRDLKQAQSFAGLIRTELAKILDLLTNLLEGKNKKMESCLIIFYTNKNNDIYKNLNLLRFKQDLEIKSSSYSQIKIGKEESNVEIIASDYSGAGKSTQIKLEIEEIKQKKYIYFPFGGVINRDDIVKRLEDLDLSEPKKIALHLDLYDTDETELMTEFLFSILINLCLCSFFPLFSSSLPLKHNTFHPQKSPYLQR